MNALATASFVNSTVVLSLVALVTGVGHILAAQRGRKQWAFWLKPLPILLFLLLAATASPEVGDTYRLLICVGLALSAVGDVMLAWPRDRFVAGLASFLLAHVAYSAAFVLRSGFAATPWVVTAVRYGVCSCWRCSGPAWGSRCALLWCSTWR